MAKTEQAVQFVEVADIRLVEGDGALKAFADIKIGERLVIKGFTVMQGKRGVFVSMPRKAGKDGKWYDMITPLDEALKNEIEDKVLEAYDKEQGGQS